MNPGRSFLEIDPTAGRSEYKRRRKNGARPDFPFPPISPPSSLPHRIGLALLSPGVRHLSPGRRALLSRRRASLSRPGSPRFPFSPKSPSSSLPFSSISLPHRTGQRRWIVWLIQRFSSSIIISHDFPLRTSKVPAPLFPSPKRKRKTLAPLRTKDQGPSPLVPICRTIQRALPLSSPSAVAGLVAVDGSDSLLLPG